MKCDAIQGDIVAKGNAAVISSLTSTATSIYQRLATVAGQQYTVGFSAANRSRSGFGLINVYMNNVLFFSTGQIVAPYQWQDYSTSFVASGATTVRFAGAGNGRSYRDSIDNVSVASEMPEPSTLAVGRRVRGLFGGGSTLSAVEDW